VAKANNSSPHGVVKEDTLLLRVNQLMQEAARRSNYKEVQRLARVAEELSVLEKRELEIARSREALRMTLESPTHTRLDSETVSARERGNRVRRQYIDGILPTHGIHLKQMDLKKYQTPDGRSVGVTYAKELEIRPSFWFLGLSDEPFDCVILLCESFDATGAEIAALVLPEECVKQIWNALSRSKGQVKFHVARTGYMSFELRLPGSHKLDVTQYLNAVKPLK
jgi:hypothetical protein